jgi:hypothetical protein
MDYFFQRIICNTYQNFDIRTSLNVLYFILRTLLNVIHTSLNIFYFILHTLLIVLCQSRNKAKECIVTSICEYWTINFCPPVIFSHTFHTWPNFHLIQQGLFPVDILFRVFCLGFVGEDHQAITPYYMQVYANFNFSTTFLTNWVHKAGVDCIWI